MIHYKTMPITTVNITMLCDYDKELTNKTMKDLYTKTIGSNKMIHSALTQVLKAKQLDHNERFLKEGKYTESFNDIVIAKCLTAHDNIYIESIKPTKYAQSQQVETVPTIYHALLSNYKRKNQKHIDLHIKKVHEFAYLKNVKSTELSISQEENTVTCQPKEFSNIFENTFGNKLIDEMHQAIASILPNNIHYDNGRFTISQNEQTFLDYLENDKYFNFNKDRVMIQNEILYISDTKFAESTLFAYALRSLKHKIIPMDRLMNTLNALIDKEEYNLVRNQITIVNIRKKIERDIIHHQTEYKHYNIAKDLLTLNTNYYPEIENLTEQSFNVDEYMKKILRLDHQPKHIVFVSKYITRFPQNKTPNKLNEGDQKKAFVFDYIKEHLQTIKVKATILNQQKTFKDTYIGHVSISLKAIHDRYIIIKTKHETMYYSLTAEIDNFDWKDKSQSKILVRDSKIIRLKDEKHLPSEISYALRGIL